MIHKSTKPLVASEVTEKFPELISKVHGLEAVTVKSLVHPHESHPEGISFVKDERLLEKAYETEKAILIVPAGKGPENIPDHIKTVMESPNAEYLMAEVIHNYFLETPYRTQAHGAGIHPTAVIHESAELGTGVQVGPGATIGAHVKIGSDVFIGANTVIESRTTIGDHSTIHPLVYIGHSTEIGKYVEVQPNTCIASEGFGYSHNHLGEHRRIPHIGKVVIEDYVQIGAAAAIDRATLDVTHIGEGTRIDNQCHIAHNVKVGKHCLITAQFVCAGSAEIGDRFVCGGKTVVAGHKKVGNNVQAAALSVFSNHHDQPGQFGGYPIMPLNDFLRAKTVVPHLVEMRKNVKKLMKAVFE